MRTYRDTRCGADVCNERLRYSGPLAPTTTNPAAAGDLKLSRTGDDNNNRELVVAVNHMAPPGNIDEELSTYVVWLKPKGMQAWTNMGQLESAQKKRTASLEVPTTYEAFDVKVTAEPRSSLIEPSNAVVLQGAISPES